MLGRGRWLLAFVRPRPALNHPREPRQHPEKLRRIGLRAGQFPRHSGDDRRSLEQTSLGIMPTAGCQEPLLKHQPNQFGVDFTQHPCWIGGAPVIEPRMAFPELKQQLNLPAYPHQRSHLGRAEQRARRIRHHHIPVG